MYPCKTISCARIAVGTEDYCPICLDKPAINDSDEMGFQTKTGTVLQPQSAADFLRAGLGHMEDRASTYDNDDGERSMASTVAMFNALTGSTISETQGWKFMACLKLVRSEQGDYKADNYEDGASYMGLAGESHSKEQLHKCEH